MAISRPKLAIDFLVDYKKRGVILIVVTQILTVMITAGILYVAGIMESGLMVFIVIVAVISLGNIFVAILIHARTARPTHDLLAAIIHISGEPTVTPLPNPNTKHNEASGFKDVLQTLYQLAGDTQPRQQQSLTAATESSIQNTESILKSALDETVCGFIVMDHDRRVTFSNKSAPIKVNSDNTASLDLLFPDDNTLNQWLDECEQSSVHNEKTWTRIADRLPDVEGRRFFDVFASYDKGAASEIVLTLIDRTSIYMVGEQELDFIAFAAHELRGPITVIRGYLDVLEEELSDVLEGDQHELFHRLTVSANRLSSYINNILNTSRYDRRHLKLRLVESTVAAVYDTITDDMQLRASSQNRLLTVTIPEDLPSIPADTASLSEVIGNLIDNAIKYSNEGGAIAVTASQKLDTVEIEVKDNGIGMPGSVVSNLFQKFYRSHRSRETVAGSGIGLYISKAIVESHGGHISVRSEEGKGSTFTVSLPTFATVADKLKAGDNSNEKFIAQGDGWIKNHSMYRG